LIATREKDHALNPAAAPRRADSVHYLDRALQPFLTSPEFLQESGAVHPIVSVQPVRISSISNLHREKRTANRNGSAWHWRWACKKFQARSLAPL
jgi:hypothetical protein